jgi:hypothetical protein
MDFFDITYATPIQFLMECISGQFPNAHLNPIFTA